MATAIDAGTVAAGSLFTDTRNTQSYTNSYEGRPTNDVFYRFALEVESTVEIKHCGSEVSDTYLHLFNSAGTRIAYNDDYSGADHCSSTLHAYLKTTLPAGTYYVASEGYSANGNITTTISFRLDGVLHGDSFDDPIDLGTFGSRSWVNTQNTSCFTNKYAGSSTSDVFYKFTLYMDMCVEINHCESTLSGTRL
jgi:hypothetical protein